jgi:hypothetical protein
MEHSPWKVDDLWWFKIYQWFHGSGLTCSTAWTCGCGRSEATVESNGNWSSWFPERMQLIDAYIRICTTIYIYTICWTNMYIYIYIYQYIYTYQYQCVYIYKYINAYIYICINIHLRIGICIYIYITIYTYQYQCVYIYTYDRYPYVCIYIHQYRNNV